MGVQKERKSRFFTAFERRVKEAVDIAVVSEYFCHLKAQCLVQPQIFVMANRFYTLYTQCQQRDDRAFCRLSLKRHTHSFAAVENNFMRFCISLTHI